VNDGVEETPPSGPLSNGLSSDSIDPDPRTLFLDLSGCNVGFKHWHPTPITHRGGKLCGQGEMGGVWEWTSSTLKRHEGFEPMELYPAYTGKAPCKGLLTRD
jgi:L-histidine Nalpha-methyltransferase / hercynylcysteine S-oxide synthase